MENNSTMVFCSCSESFVFKVSVSHETTKKSSIVIVVDLSCARSVIHVDSLLLSLDLLVILLVLYFVNPVQS